MVLAKSVKFSEEMMHVVLTDGRIISAPLARFPRLHAATPEQRDRYEIGGGGIGLHWAEIDEDLSVAGFLAEGLADLSSLSVDDRLQLVEGILESIDRDQPPEDLTEAQKEELDRRVADLDADPNNVLTWEEIKAKILSRR